MSFCIWVCRLLRNVVFEGSLELFLQWHLMTTECQTLRQFQMIASGLLLNRDEQMSILYDSIFSTKWREHEQHGGVCSHQPYLYIDIILLGNSFQKNSLIKSVLLLDIFIGFQFFQSIISTFRSLLSTSPYFHGNLRVTTPMLLPPHQRRPYEWIINTTIVT